MLLFQTIIGDTKHYSVYAGGFMLQNYFKDLCQGEIQDSKIGPPRVTVTQETVLQTY